MEDMLWQATSVFTLHECYKLRDLATSKDGEMTTVI